MSDNAWADVDAFLNGVLLGDDPVLDAALADSQAAGLPAINVAPNQGKMLMLLAQMAGDVMSRFRRVMFRPVLAATSKIAASVSGPR